MNPYRQRVWSILKEQLQSCAPLDSALDFGSGDGWFASRVRAEHLVRELVPLDVKRRATVFVEPRLYVPGEALPFAAHSFDLSYSVDVLHHCDDPFAQLDELDRVTKRYLLIKDHNYHTAVGQFALAVLDELGNRKFGIPSPYQYQKAWAWTAHLQARGWRQKTLVHPARCHVGPMGALTNSLQYVALFERESG
jgi:SAM-dependent methyltransferase